MRKNELHQLDEQYLVSLMAVDDGDAFTEIYKRYWKKLYFLAHKHLKSAEASEEIIQEVFLALWKKRHSIQIHSLPLYLAAMTRYAVYSSLARQKKYHEIDLASLKQEPATVSDSIAIDNRLLMEMIQKLSGKLPEKCRLVFIHNKLLDQPLAQVAEALNISTKTAEAHLTKALKIIRGNLGGELSALLLLSDINFFT